MTDSTNARAAAIQSAAQRILADSGIDISAEINVQPLARQLADENGCNYVTAKRHIRKAIDFAKGIPLPTRGGPRGGGWPKGKPRKKQLGSKI